MNTLVKEKALDTYKEQSRNALKDMKEHCESDQFITDCRRIAHEKINNALDKTVSLFGLSFLNL